MKNSVLRRTDGQTDRSQVHVLSCASQLKRIIKQRNVYNCTQVILLTLQECTFNEDLKNVRLTKIPQTVFHYSKETKDINLSNNNIEEIQEETFNGLFIVEKLDLSSNKISLVNSVMFSDLNQLNILNLSMNSLESIINLVLPRSVGVIDLSWNSLDNSQNNVFSSVTPFEVKYLEESINRKYNPSIFTECEISQFES